MSKIFAHFASYIQCIYACYGCATPFPRSAPVAHFITRLCEHSITLEDRCRSLLGNSGEMTTSRSMTTHHRFHCRCGEYISLSDNNTVAERVYGYHNGIVFTEQPVALGTVFQVKILEYGGGILSIVSD